MSAVTHDALGYAELCRPGAVAYLEKHKIPQLFRSLVAALMVEQPPDHVAFIKKTLARAMEVGVAHLDWETFVYALHPKRSPERLEYVRDGTPYERQGVELIERRLQGRPALVPRASPSPPLPPLSPAPSLTSESGGNRGDATGASDLFELTQGQWEISGEGASAARPGSGGSGAALLLLEQRRQLLSSPGAQEYVSDEVDKLLSEAIVLSVAARGGSPPSAPAESPDSSAALVASLQAKLAVDAGRSDVLTIGDDEEGQVDEEDDNGLYD